MGGNLRNPGLKRIGVTALVSLWFAIAAGAGSAFATDVVKLDGNFKIKNKAAVSANETFWLEATSVQEGVSKVRVRVVVDGAVVGDVIRDVVTEDGVRKWTAPIPPLRANALVELQFAKTTAISDQKRTDLETKLREGIEELLDDLYSVQAMEIDDYRALLVVRYGKVLSEVFGDSILTETGEPVSSFLVTHFSQGDGAMVLESLVNLTARKTEAEAELLEITGGLKSCLDNRQDTANGYEISGITLQVDVLSGKGETLCAALSGASRDGIKAAIENLQGAKPDQQAEAEDGADEDPDDEEVEEAGEAEEGGDAQETGADGESQSDPCADLGKPEDWVEHFELTCGGIEVFEKAIDQFLNHAKLVSEDLTTVTFSTDTLPVKDIEYWAGFGIGWHALSKSDDIVPFAMVDIHLWKIELGSESRPWKTGADFHKNLSIAVGYGLGSIEGPDREAESYFAGLGLRLNPYFRIHAGQVLSWTKPEGGERSQNSEWAYGVTINLRELGHVLGLFGGIPSTISGG